MGQAAGQATICKLNPASTPGFSERSWPGFRGVERSKAELPRGRAGLEPKVVFLGVGKLRVGYQRVRVLSAGLPVLERTTREHDLLPGCVPVQVEIARELVPRPVLAEQGSVFR